MTDLKQKALEIRRNKNGTFVKGSKPMVPFKKGEGYWTGKKLSQKHKENIGLGEKGRTAWNKGIKKPKTKCCDCGKELNRRSSKFCSKCVKKGERHPLWQGGISFLPYPVDWTGTLKRSIRERDGYVCQLCRTPQGDFALSVHHIDYDKNNCNPTNLVSLCKRCHLATNHNRTKWTKFFNIKNGLN